MRIRRSKSINSASEPSTFNTPYAGESTLDSPLSSDNENVEFVRTFQSSITNDEASLSLYFKHDIDFLKELEAQIKKVASAISLLDKKMVHASNQDKMKYLQEQNELYKEQQALIDEQIRKSGHLDKQKNWMQSELKKKKFNLNDNGEITNYEELLSKKAEELKKLEDKSTKKNASESARKKYEDAKKEYDELKKLADEYIELESTSIPKLSEEWEDYNNKRIENEKKLKEMQEEAWKVRWDAQWTSANKHVDELKNEIAMVDVLMKNAFGTDKDELLKKKIELLNQQKVEMQDTNDLLKMIIQKSN